MVVKKQATVAIIQAIKASSMEDIKGRAVAAFDS